MEKIYLAGGCFWGVEKYLGLLPGVIATSVGYANGRASCPNPSYEEVCRENTGHAETVEVEYDPSQVSLAFLLERFFEAIDPCSLNRQGADVGAQYRSGIYYIDEFDVGVIRESLERLQAAHDKPVVVEVEPLAHYYLAEEYHQKYLDKNPGGYCHIGRAKFARAREAVDVGNAPR